MLSTKSNQYSTTWSDFDDLFLVVFVVAFEPWKLTVQNENATTSTCRECSLTKWRKLPCHRKNHSNSQLNLEKYFITWIENWTLMRTNYLKHMFHQEKLKVDSSCFPLAFQNCFYYPTKNDETSTFFISECQFSCLPICVPNTIDSFFPINVGFLIATFFSTSMSQWGIQWSWLQGN